MKKIINEIAVFVMLATTIVNSAFAGGNPINKYSNLANTGANGELVTATAQNQAPLTKDQAQKRVVSGAVITSIGGAFLITGGTLMGLAVPVALSEVNKVKNGGKFNMSDVIKPAAMVGTGLVLTIAAIPMCIVGPIKLVNGLKAKKAAASSAELTPMPILAPTASGYQVGFGMRVRF